MNILPLIGSINNNIPRSTGIVYLNIEYFIGHGGDSFTEFED